jgi:hypothetical protein
MVHFFASLLRLFFRVFRSRSTIVSEIALLRKENEILLRRVGKQRVHFSFYDKLFVVVLNRAADIKHRLTLGKPETVFSWQQTFPLPTGMVPQKNPGSLSLHHQYCRQAA